MRGLDRKVMDGKQGLMGGCWVEAMNQHLIPLTLPPYVQNLGLPFWPLGLFELERRSQVFVFLFVASFPAFLDTSSGTRT